MVYVCQPHVLHVRSRPCHRARGEARRHQQDQRQAHGDPDCPDGRVAHNAHLRKLHSISCHLRLDGRDLTEYIIREGDCSGLHRKTLLLGMDYDTVLTTVVIHKEKTNELIDNIFTVQNSSVLLVASHLAVSA